MGKGKHKQDKAKKRAKLVKKGAYDGDAIRVGMVNKERRDRYEQSLPTNLRELGMSKEELLAQRKPIEEAK